MSDEAPEHPVTIGASKIAAICGLSPFSTPYQVAAELKGLAPPRPVTEDMRRGTCLEPGILRWLQDSIGKEIDTAQRKIICPQFPWAHATPDGIIAEKIPVPVEVKSPSRGTSDQWTNRDDGIPIYYLPQVMWQMGCLEADEAIVAALVVDALKIYRIPFRADLWQALVRRVSDFRDRYLMTDEMPEPSVRDMEIYTMLLPKKMKPAVRLIGDMEIEGARLVEDYLKLTREAAAIQDERREVRMSLARLTGEAEAALGEDYTISWVDRKGSVNWKKLAEELGTDESLKNKYRGKQSRYLRIKSAAGETED